MFIVDVDRSANAPLLLPLLKRAPLYTYSLMGATTIFYVYTRYKDIYTCIYKSFILGFLSTYKKSRVSRVILMDISVICCICHCLLYRSNIIIIITPRPPHPFRGSLSRISVIVRTRACGLHFFKKTWAFPELIRNSLSILQYPWGFDDAVR